LQFKEEFERKDNLWTAEASNKLGKKLRLGEGGEFENLEKGIAQKDV